jgi:hypothetical protein
MPYDISTSQLRSYRYMPKRTSLVLDGARGTTIAVEQGTLWVTLEHDPRDVILVAGMRFEVDRDGRTIVAAEDDSRLRLIRRRTASERVASWINRKAVALLRSFKRRTRTVAVPYY